MAKIISRSSRVYRENLLDGELSSCLLRSEATSLFQERRGSLEPVCLMGLGDSRAHWSWEDAEGSSGLRQVRREENITKPQHPQFSIHNHTGQGRQAGWSSTAPPPPKKKNHT